MASKLTVSTKGHLINPNCQYKDGVILENNGAVYDCTLNQTDINSNKNKFYIMQLIKHADKFIVFVCYGRIGERGKCIYKNFSSQNQGISFFESQFRSKTGNAWSNRDNFEKKPGKYYMTEIECAEVETDDSDSSQSQDEIELDARVVDFMKMITNTTYMKNTLIQLEIDTEKLPLGKISQTQIDKAYEILNDINNNMGDSEKLVLLSSEYYTLIPLACGRQKPPVINNKKLVAKNINLLNELSQMVYGTKAITKQKSGINIMQLYEKIETIIKPIEHDDDIYKILETYIKNSRAPTHNFEFDIINIFELERQLERDNYETFSAKLKNKTLLFHGTRVSNIYSILGSGLIVDPSKLGINVQITGKMFGLGLYFANSCSKSIQYCAFDSSNNNACLFIAEVALGKKLEKKQADVGLTAKTLPKGYHSTWGIGRSSYKTYDQYDDGTQIPHGKIRPIKENSDSCLLYDEFIVYQEYQISLKYIVQLKIKNNDDSD